MDPVNFWPDPTSLNKWIYNTLKRDVEKIKHHCLPQRWGKSPTCKISQIFLAIAAFISSRFLISPLQETLASPSIWHGSFCWYRYGIWLPVCSGQPTKVPGRRSRPRWTSCFGTASASSPLSRESNNKGASYSRISYLLLLFFFIPNCLLHS